jgi:hypothetical protein
MLLRRRMFVDLSFVCNSRYIVLESKAARVREVSTGEVDVIVIFCNDWLEFEAGKATNRNRSKRNSYPSAGYRYA